MVRKVVSWFLLSVSLALVGCGNNTDDLEEWIASVKARPAGKPQPIPEVKPYDTFEYSAQGLRSPFRNTEPELEGQLAQLQEDCATDLQPDPARRREDLERYAIDAIKMVGTMFRQGQRWALVQPTAGPNAGTVYRVTEGNYLGANHGQISDISEEKVTLNTLFLNSQGCWEQRTVYLTVDN